jgi:hypothetical protein
VHVDRLEVDALLGEKFLGAQARGASGLPEHLDAGRGFDSSIHMRFLSWTSLGSADSASWHRPGKAMVRNAAIADGEGGSLYCPQPDARRMQRLDPTTLKLFVRVVEEGTIAAAADSEHIAAAP